MRLKATCSCDGFVPGGSTVHSTGIVRSRLWLMVKSILQGSFTHQKPIEILKIVGIKMTDSHSPNTH
jgi:hypothetical protein